MRSFTDQDMFELEALVDSVGLRRVLLMLSNICGEKADHILSNWQDASL